MAYRVPKENEGTKTECLDDAIWEAFSDDASFRISKKFLIIRFFYCSSFLSTVVSFSYIDEHWSIKIVTSFCENKISFLSMLLIVSCNLFKIESVHLFWLIYVYLIIGQFGDFDKIIRKLGDF